MSGYDWLIEQIDADRQRAETLEPRERRRLLVDCDLKEEIVRHAIDWFTTLHETPPGRTEGECTTYRMAMEWVLYRITLMYDDRPGFTEQGGYLWGDAPTGELALEESP